MATKPLPNIERLRNLYDYDARTGIITNKVSNTDTRASYIVGAKRNEYSKVLSGTGAAGTPAEIPSSDGRYFVVWTPAGRLSAHRVAWALHYGEWPSGALDHINRNGTDNRISNLRLASAAENACNRTKADAKHSKYLGVTWLKGRWVASIGKGGKKKHLGSFDNEEDAALAYDCAAVAIHREFANPNIIKNPYLTEPAK